MKLALSIAISSTRPVHTCALLSSLMPQVLKQDQVIVIFDIPIEAKIREIFTTTYQNIEIHYNEGNRGLCFCRNLGMQKAKNDHLIFFDDDVLLPKNILNRYRYFFSQGVKALGGPLKLPRFYQSLPLWLPEGLSSLLSIHTCQKRIWGGNFGFDLKLALQYGIFFKEDLGRKSGGLQSGDETDFLNRYRQFTGASKFIEDLFVYHCIDTHRFKMPYLVKRAYWQGRSEKRKMSVWTGIQKELHRALTISNPEMVLRIVQSFVGCILFFSFCFGILVETTRLILQRTLSQN